MMVLLISFEDRQTLINLAACVKCDADTGGFLMKENR